VVLYEHLWKDTIKYVKKPLTVSGIDKITVRYPGIGMTNEAAATRAADSAAIEQARLDSIRIKIAGDLAAKPAVPRKVKYHNLAIIAVVISGLLILAVALLVLVKNRRRTRGINTKEGKDRFGNL
jgi:hypothetical protein